VLLLAVCFDRVTAGADWLRKSLASKFIFPTKLSDVTIIIIIFCYFSLFRVFIICAFLYTVVNTFLHLYIILLASIKFLMNLFDVLIALRIPAVSAGI
jgi:hypothetical protein